MHSKQKLLYTGKAKSLYETDDPNYLIAEFRDDTTAFDGVKKEKLAEKGRVNNAISTYILQQLDAANIKTHLVEMLSPTDTLVRRLTMIPLESVIRNVAAGSLCKRLGITQGTPLSPPVYEIFLKDDGLHDPMINDNHAVAFGWATTAQLDSMKMITHRINELLSTMFAKAGLVLVDAKFEFGVDQAGEIYLADEISPDACRIWDAVTQEPLDKDRFRKDLGNVVESYKAIAERLGVDLSL